MTAHAQQKAQKRIKTLSFYLTLILRTDNISKNKDKKTAILEEENLISSYHIIKFKCLAFNNKNNHKAYI